MQGLFWDITHYLKDLDRLYPGKGVLNLWGAPFPITQRSDYSGFQIAVSTSKEESFYLYNRIEGKSVLFQPNLGNNRELKNIGNRRV